jgi:protein disulfide-isomerase A6
MFFWLQAGDQLELERHLGLGFGFPAVVAISPSKNLFATMRSAFDAENVSIFMTKTVTGSTPFDPIPKSLLRVKKASKWNGKDASPIGEDSYDDEL